MHRRVRAHAERTRLAQGAHPIGAWRCVHMDKDPFAVALEQVAMEKYGDTDDPVIAKRMRRFEAAMAGFPPLVRAGMLYMIREGMRTGGEIDQIATLGAKRVIDGLSLTIFYLASHAGATSLCRDTLFNDLLAKGVASRLADRYRCGTRGGTARVRMADAEAALMTAALFVIEGAFKRNATARDRIKVFRKAVWNEANRILSSDAKEQEQREVRKLRRRAKVGEEAVEIRHQRPVSNQEIASELAVTAEEVEAARAPIPVDLDELEKAPVDAAMITKTQRNSSVIMKVLYGKSVIRSARERK